MEIPLSDFNLKNLIECRSLALKNGSDTKTQLSANGKWIDLLSKVGNTWYYITTIPNK